MTEQHRVTAADGLRRHQDEGLFGEGPLDFNGINLDGDSPLHLAAWRRDIEEFMALLEGGADVNAIGDMGQTPLHVAASVEHVEMITQLLARGASTAIIDEFETRAYDIAKRHGLDEMLPLLS